MNTSAPKSEALYLDDLHVGRETRNQRGENVQTLLAKLLVPRRTATSG